MASITYVFHIGEEDFRFPLTFDPQSFTLIDDGNAQLPEWTRLEFRKCPHCPLPETTETCPYAGALSRIVSQLEPFYSYTKAVVEVISAQRTVISALPLQSGVASLIGLVGATSGCPSLAFLRPMARFHLPFASEQETLFRAFSMFLLGEYLREGGQGKRPLSIEGIRAHYEDAAKVNHGMADRVRGGAAKDAVVNAVVILNTFAQAAPYVIDEALAELREIYTL